MTLSRQRNVQNTQNTNGNPFPVIFMSLSRQIFVFSYALCQATPRAPSIAFFSKARTILTIQTISGNARHSHTSKRCRTLIRMSESQALQQPRRHPYLSTVNTIPYCALPGRIVVSTGVTRSVHVAHAVDSGC